MPAGDEPPGWILKSWNCSFELTNVTTTFGKEDSDCLIPFRSVSKHHAVITWDGKKQQYKIKEAPFSLGTFVNDSRIGVRTIIITLGDSVRFGADSPTFRIEIKEKEKDFGTPRKTLSTVHDMEKEDVDQWPEKRQSQTVVSNNSQFVVTPISNSSPHVKASPKPPAQKITTYEPPEYRDDSPVTRPQDDSPLIRASRDLSLSRSSMDELRANRASTPNSSSTGRQDNKQVRNKGPKGSALYGEPTWWGEEEAELNSPSTPDIQRAHRRTPVHSRSTEFDPFDGYAERHEYADLPSPVPSRGVDNSTYNRQYSRERGYNGANNNNHGAPHEHHMTPHDHHVTQGRPMSAQFYDEDRMSERSSDRYTDRSYTGNEERRHARQAPQPRYDQDTAYTPPPAKPGTAFQITFDQPKTQSPRRKPPGKKKRGTPPQDNEKRRGTPPKDNEDKKSNISGGSERSHKSCDSNRSCDHKETRRNPNKLSGSEEGSNKSQNSSSHDNNNTDMRIDDIELTLPDEEPNNRQKSDEEVSQTSSSLAEEHQEDPATKKELTQWANSVFKSRDYVPVFSIHDAVKDGRTLAQLIHCIADEKVPELLKDPKLRVEILPNIDKCLNFCKNNNLIIGEIASREIVKGYEQQTTILLEQLRAAHKRRLERPAVPKPSDDNRNNICEAELTDDEEVLPFRRHKTMMAAPPRTKRPTQPPVSAEAGDDATIQLEKLMLHTLRDLTQRLKSKADKSAVFSLHLKEELDSLAGNNAPDEFVANSIDNEPVPGSVESNTNNLPESEITQALKDLRFLEKRLAEIEDNLIYVRNETVPLLAAKETGKPKKKKKGVGSVLGCLTPRNPTPVDD